MSRVMSNGRVFEKAGVNLSVVYGSMPQEGAKVQTVPKKALTNVLTPFPQNKLASALQGAEQIVCRSGYSSLLDLAALNVLAVLVPTPGQAEQAYLAKHWAASFGFATCSQSQLEHGEIPKVQGELPGEMANERAFQMLLLWVTPSQE